MLNWPTAIVLSTLIVCIFMVVIYVIGKRMEKNEKKNDEKTFMTVDADELTRQLLLAAKERKNKDDQ